MPSKPRKPDDLVTARRAALRTNLHRIIFRDRIQGWTDAAAAAASAGIFASLNMDGKAMLDCLDREIRMREEVYARRVGAGKMLAGTAAREIALMTSAADLIAALLPPPAQGGLDV